MRFALLFVLAVVASSQPLQYSLLSAEGPSARLDGTIAYDPVGRQVFLFGGSDSVNRNDLWSYSLAERRWREIAVAGSQPPARLGHTLNYDAARRRLLVFGGQASGFFSDVWAFDIAAAQWTQLARDQAGPSNRYGHSAIYDAARERLVISHGFTDAGRFDDTWAFDLRTNAWRNVSPASGRPVRRCLHHAVYDGANAMLLYGGCASGFGPCPLGDLWSFDLAAGRWTELRAAPAPAPRQHYGLTFDEMRRRLVLFGGAGRGSLNDTWEFDPAAAQWREIAVAGVSPSPRSRHQGVYAADRGVSFFFGGSTSGGLSNELWMLGPGFATAPELTAVANAFSGAGEGVSPGEIVSLYGANLGPLEGVAFGFDETGRLPVSGPGVAVTFDGVAAPLLYVRQDQVNVQVPYELAGGALARVQLSVHGAASALTVPLRATHPGLFPRAFHPDGRLVTAEDPAGGVVVLFATGQGLTSPASRTGVAAAGVYPPPLAPVRLTIGGRETELLFAGQAPGTAGVMQLNARVPAGLSGQLELVLRVGDGESRMQLPVR